MSALPTDANVRLAEALDYATKYQWRVVPAHSVKDGRCSCGCDDPACNSRGKHPRIMDWTNAATTDTGKIREWWEHWPDSNILIATGPDSNLAVLDIDPAKGGFESLAVLEQQNGNLPDTVQAISGSNGRHYVFAHPGPHLKIPSRAEDFAPGLDIKADGGGFIVEPSRHWSGGRYFWDFERHPDETPIAQMPKWLLDLTGTNPRL